MKNPEREWPIGGQIRLNAEGTGDYPTLQDAIHAIEHNNLIHVDIYLAPGIYEQPVMIDGDRPHITLIGEDAENTIISFDRHAGSILENGDVASTFRSATFTVYANHFKARNITFVNHYDRTGDGGAQAVALYAYGEHHIYENCRFIGLQDTLYVREGSHYFKDCYIEGDVDFVFGGARAVFDHCTLFGRNPEPGNPDKIGYICAPCTVAAQKYGLFFINCSIDGNFEKDRLYLGRPWHPAMNPYHNCCAVFMHCQMSDVVRETGWKHMGGYQVRNNRLYEFENTGAGAFVNDNRRQLDPETAKDWTILKVLGWENLGWMETSAEE